MAAKEQAASAKGRGKRRYERVSSKRSVVKNPYLRAGTENLTWFPERSCGSVLVAGFPDEIEERYRELLRVAEEETNKKDSAAVAHRQE